MPDSSKHEPHKGKYTKVVCKENYEEGMETKGVQQT